MISNPEFIKNIRLQLNPVKLLLMPIILSMIFFVVYLFNADSKEPIEYTMQVTALFLLGLIVFIWGTKMAVDSLAGEFNERTWDSQRMTAIGPWNLVWGKLFGSTLYAWYGGLLCLLFFAVAAFLSPDPSRFLELLLLLLFAGVFIQSSLLAFILTEFAKNRDLGKLSLSSYSVIGLLPFFFLPSFAMGAYDAHSTVRWYSIELHPMRMLLSSALFFCLWGVTGFYRAMRKELQFDTGPWVWSLFVLSLMIYASGFVINNGRINFLLLVFYALYISFAIGTASFYLMALAEPKSIVDIRWLVDKARQGKQREFFVKMPAWSMSLLLVVLLCLALLCMKLSMHSLLVDAPKSLRNLVELSPLAFLLFCLRDLGIILYVNLNSTGKNRDLVAVFYLIILYGLLPSILNAADAKLALPWFFPLPDTSFLNSVVPVAVQAAGIFFLLYKLLATNFRKKGEKEVRTS